MAERLPLPTEIHSALTVTEAAALIERHYFDVILIDLQGSDGTLAGLELLRYLSQVGGTSSVALMTHLDLDMNHTNIMNTIAVSRSPHIDRFIDKRRSSNFILDAVEAKSHELRGATVEITGLDFLADLVLSRRKRYRQAEALGLRDQVELQVELDRLFRRLFVNRVYGTRQTSVAVELSPMERLGLSAAVIVKARVRLRVEGVRSKSSYDCVLKVGPRNEISEEAGRYLEFVQFGVRLEERVELLAHAQGDSVGAIVYSVAGGSLGSTASLDELFLADTAIAAQVIERLFASTNWYDTRADPASIRQFFDVAYRMDFPSAFDAARAPLEKAIERAGGKLRFNSDQEVEITDHKSQKFLMPARSFGGVGRVLRPYEWCLVHGDMHGGNVIAEVHERKFDDGTSGRALGRVSLIDYRQAGPGPRCIDAAALECAIRSADAQAITAIVPDPVEAARAALATFSRERSLIRYQWGNGKRPGETANDASGWQALSDSVVCGARHALREPEIGSEEYLLTCLLFALRQLRYPTPSVARLRIAAWVGALYNAYSLLSRDTQ
jgi:CheY-like chemotaxis protein